MSDPEGFLTRWSRRKLESDREGPEPEAADRSDAALSEDGAGIDRATAEAMPVSPAGDADEETRIGETRTAEPEIDLASLPPVESIDATSDITAFLKSGVPAELTRAALRRVWTSDPAIRDFIEVAENQWDFATGVGIPGFGPIEASEELTRIASRIAEAGRPDFPEPRLGRAEEPGQEPEIPSASDDTTVARGLQAPDEQAERPEEEAATPHPDTAENSGNNPEPVHVAMQQERPVEPPTVETAVSPARRPHGRALPQ
jgi:hypothetical protein